MKAKTSGKAIKISTKRRTSSSTPARPSRKIAGHSQTVTETTMVLECTRPGCGYRIWRDGRGEPGQLRYDIKCPKCHNEEFKCLGKGDLPESFETPITEQLIDFAQSPVNVDSD